MIKEAINYLISLATPASERVIRIEDANGHERVLTFDDAGIANEIPALNPRAKEALKINTLSGLVDYIQAKIEREENSLILHVVDESTVCLKGKLDFDGGREVLAVANAIIPKFQFDSFHTAEQLIISLQAKFKPTDDRKILLQVLGNVKEENVRQTGDSGIAQVVTMKTGVAAVDDVVVPNPVTLAPYRTFVEVEQPESKFIFRMKDGPAGAIFEADGGAWRNEAISNISDYLKAALADEIGEGHITVIS